MGSAQPVSSPSNPVAGGIFSVDPHASRLAGLLSTTIGRKLGMALSGIALIGFLGAHMIGNLRILFGADALNGYADFLQSNPLLWGMRVALAAVFCLHVYLATTLHRLNTGARPTRYATGAVVRDSNFASRHLFLTGALILAFVVFHVFHFTLHQVAPYPGPALDSLGRPDVYSRLVHGFQNPVLVVTYLVAMGVLGLYLSHGARSLFRTFGLGHESYDLFICGFAYGLVALIVLRNSSIPLLVLFGAIR